MKRDIAGLTLSALVCMGCGSGIEDLREQIRATHERFGEVHEIYTNAYEELYSHRVITRGWDDCPRPEFSYSKTS